MHALTPTLQAELVGRLLLAVLLGSVLGWERETARHPAGLRTHMLVSLGAAAYTVAGIYGVADVFSSGYGSVQDPGRVAAQIIVGIGFLGAGTIWRSSANEGVIRGLTTAASIWVAASIGMLTGYGLYVLATGTAVISFAVLRLIKGAERAPQALGRAVASRFARRAAPQRDVIYQPARAPAVMEAPPRVPVPDGQAEPGEVPSPDSDDEPALVEPETPAIEPAAEPDRRDQVHKKLTKKLRKGKKGRKEKQRDFVSEDSDHISDAPEFPLPSAAGG